jgi:hypothetical protein
VQRCDNLLVQAGTHTPPELPQSASIKLLPLPAGSRKFNRAGQVRQQLRLHSLANRTPGKTISGMVLKNACIGFAIHAAFRISENANNGTLKCFLDPSAATRQASWK